MQIATTIPLTGRQVIVATWIRLPEPWCSPLVQSVIDHEGRLPRDEAARTLCLSPVQFSRNFRKRLGCSFRTAQMFLRLQLGAHYLRYTPLRVSEIADRLRYGDLKKFDRAFKQHFQMSPSEYRRGKAQQDSEEDTWVLFSESLHGVKNDMSKGNVSLIQSNKLCA